MSFRSLAAQRRMRTLPSVALLLAATSACAPGTDLPADLPAATQLRTLPMDRDLQSMVEAALDDGARRTGLPRAEVKVVSAERVTWSDGSLGCPQPGVGYTQALVPGYRIRIQAGAEVLSYHARSRGQPILCPHGRSIDPVPEGPA